MRRTGFLSLFILLTLYHQHSYAHVRKPDGDTSLVSCREKAGRLLTEILTLMQRHYYRRDSVQWAGLRADAESRLANASSCDDAYEIINDCFKRLDEPHSFIMPPANTALYQNDSAALNFRPALDQLVGRIIAERTDDGVGYLSVPWVRTSDSAICTLVADSLQKAIAGLDRQGVSKWIIDLRNNTGGNCWPMLAGIGPLLGDGLCGYFVYHDTHVPIRYENGAAICGTDTRCRVSSTGYRLKNPRPYIILLIGPRTCSAGELVALAFKQKAGVRFYGEPTAGLTTANATYPLCDGSTLVLTVCLEADRTGELCQGPLLPDETIASPGSADRHDATESAAEMWLAIQ